PRMPLEFARQPQTAAPHYEMRVWRCHRHAPARRADELSVHRIEDAESGLAIEPLRECRGKRLVDMQDQQQRQRKASRQGAQNLEDRAGSSCGCANRDDLALPSSRRMDDRPGLRSAVRLAESPQELA